MSLTRRSLLAGTAAAALVGCGKSSALTFGSKNFQEQWILAALIAELIKRKTKKSARTKDFAGTFLVHKAITSGNIDGYVEYTGTAYTAVLEHPRTTDVAAVYRAVKRDYAAKFDLLVLPPLGFENTFAILVRKKAAAEHGLRRISDLARVAASFRPGFGFEFYERKDGYRGLLAAYGLDFGKRPKQMKLGLTYRALSAGHVDVIAGNSTDGLIEHLDLVMLEDDKRYFPPYQAAPVLRRATAEKHPQVRAAIESLAGTISSAAMRKANFRIDNDKVHPRKAALELLDSLELGA